MNIPITIKVQEKIMTKMEQYIGINTTDWGAMKNTQENQLEHVVKGSKNTLKNLNQISLSFHHS